MSSIKSLQNVFKLYELYETGVIQGPQKHEVHHHLPLGSRENYLYFTLPCCINFQRNSPAMWQSAFDTYKDENTRYVYFPELSTTENSEKFREDMIRHKLALQTNKHPKIWMSISETLASHYDSDPRNVLEEGDFDILKITQMLQKDKKKLFPYLGGIKLSNYWLFILSRFTDVQFKNPEAISIIPDTHVIKSTIRLGLAEEGVKSPEVELIWRELLRDTHITPPQMHPVLWTWSRNGFTPSLDLEDNDPNPKQLPLWQ